MPGFADGEYSGTRWFFNNDDLIKKNPDYHLTVNMASVRCDGLESAIDFADEYNFCTADGQILFQKKGDEYRRIIGTWDVMALPGITARKGMEQLVPVSNWRGYCSKHNFAGAATRGGENAVAGFYFEKMNGSEKDGVNDRGAINQKNPLLYGIKAHKSYFMLGDYLIALGAGITNLHTDVEGDIHTTIDQTAKSGIVRIHKGKEVSELAKPGSAVSFLQDGNPVWVAQEGGFAYTILPEHTANANFIYEQKANEWDKRNQSNKKKTGLPETADILRLWIDHGTAPVDATYGYVVYCGEGIPAEKKHPFRVLRNDTLVQAVQLNDKSVVEAVFYQDNQTLKAGNLVIGTSSPAVVLLEKAGKEYQLTVNDPEMNADLKELTVIINKKLIKIEMPQGEFCGKPVTRRIGKL
ncbi:MAG: polysaccharide lyase family 8 super-sandwich domain-containing protein [Bacteroidales bacterium]